MRGRKTERWIVRGEKDRESGRERVRAERGESGRVRGMSGR